jgi:hypothetical protein
VTLAYHTAESAKALVERIHARTERLRAELAVDLAHIEERIAATRPGPDLDHLLGLRRRAVDLLRDCSGPVIGVSS